MTFSIPYILFIILLLAIALLQSTINLNERSLRTLSVLAIIVFVLFFGGRGLIGWDWTNYYRDFRDAVSLSGFAHHQWMFKDPGWNLYVSLITTITDLIGIQGHAAFNFFVFVSTLIDGVLIYHFLLHSVTHKYFVFAFSVFFVFYGFTFETDLMRNAKGLMLFLIALRYVETREWFKYFALALLACTFHWSILVLVPCYFFIHRKIPMPVILTIFVIGNIIYLFGLPSISLIIRQVAQFMPGDIQERVLNYVASAVYGKEYGLSLGYIERTLVYLLVLFYQHKMISDDKNILIYINAMSIFIFICLYCYEFNIFITRFGALFCFGSWVMYAKLLKYMDKITGPILAILISGIIIVKMHNLSNNILYKYDNFLIEEVDSYDHRLEVFYAYKQKLLTQ